MSSLAQRVGGDHDSLVEVLEDSRIISDTEFHFGQLRRALFGPSNKALFHEVLPNLQNANNHPAQSNWMVVEL